MNHINLLFFCAVCFSSLFTNLEVTLFKDPRAFVCKFYLSIYLLKILLQGMLFLSKLDIVLCISVFFAQGL